MVGKMRNGTTSKTKRTNSHAVGLEEAVQAVVRSCGTDMKGSVQTCNTRSTVHEQTMGGTQVHCTAHLETRTRSRSPVVRQVIIDRDITKNSMQAHQEEEAPYARLEARDVVARLPV